MQHYLKGDGDIILSQSSDRWRGRFSEMDVETHLELDTLVKENTVIKLTLARPVYRPGLCAVQTDDRRGCKVLLWLFGSCCPEQITAQDDNI